ncbi:MAG: DEAD/DEAH box helicase [Alphaproteobacteria bacterium]|nr:DEAD/DEAH box helicase [Alphaproteobacteria bacterium]
MTFNDLGLGPDVLRAVTEKGYETPTPIQAKAIPEVLKGRDVLGLAQTGTGKTASFTLPLIDILARGRAKARIPRSVILEPTRELAAQVAEHFELYGKYHKLSTALLIGGVSFGDQDKKLDRGVDVLIATPGRLLDHCERGKLMLTGTQILVIDEADRMLDMGFIPDIERIAKLIPFTRQTLFFSATMPKEIERLVDQFLHNPVRVEVAPPASPAEKVTQALVRVRGEEKRDALRHLIRTQNVKNAIIFCNRKRDVGTLASTLARQGFSAGALHGDMDQRHRIATLEQFRNGTISLLVASDVAARGLDIPEVSHVFNFDVPIHAEDYIHRIGRTGRAGRSGAAFTLASSHDGKHVAAIESLIGKAIPPMALEGFVAEPAEEAEASPSRERGPRGRGRGRSRGEGRGEARGERSERQAERPAPEAAAPEKAPEEPRPPRAERSERGRRGGRREEADPPVLGLGEHTPAFLLKPVRLPKGRLSDAIDGEDEAALTGTDG